METKASFDLNQTIFSWRCELAESPALLPENLDELEIHLRDSIGVLESAGLSLEESFIIARRRLGNCRSIGEEFGWVNRNRVWLDRVLWMLIGIQLWSSVVGLSGFVTRGITFFAVRRWHILPADFSMTPLVLLATVQVLCLGIICLLGFWFLGRKSETLVCWMRKFIARRKMLLSVAVIACLASIVIPAGSFGMSAWSFKFLPVEELGRFALVQQWAAVMLMALQPAVLIALTVFVVRRRLSISSR